MYLFFLVRPAEEVTLCWTMKKFFLNFIFSASGIVHFFGAILTQGLPKLAGSKMTVNNT